MGNINKLEHIKWLMRKYPVKKLQSHSKEHARHAVEQGLANGDISREIYDVLIGYVIHRMKFS